MKSRIKRNRDEVLRLKNVGYMEIPNGTGAGFSCNRCIHLESTDGRPQGVCTLAEVSSKVDIVRGCCNSFRPLKDVPVLELD